MRWIIGLQLLCLLSPATLQADFPNPKLCETSNPFPGVRIQALSYDQPRPLRGWAVRIDLTQPNLEFVVTPKEKVDDGFETACSTTLAFAQKEQLQLAINASPFSPFRQKPGEFMKINGLHLSRGVFLSQDEGKRGNGALVIRGDNQANILSSPISPEMLQHARHGVGGFLVVLKDGKPMLSRQDPPAAPVHPRTAVGLSDRGKYLWWLIVDGRQKGISEGLTYNELGDWAQSLGISDLLNLDGGGSSTLVLQDAQTKQHQVINTPVGKGPPGSLRLNGNHLGMRIYAAPDDLTLEQLQVIMPRLKTERAKLFLGPLNRAMARYQINTPLRRAAFLAQLAHESGELRYMEEIASGEAYEGRQSLGNTESGDGKRFKGRGPIQLTGRANYRAAGVALGLDLENHPQQATDPEMGCLIAGWFWDTRKLNEFADVGDFKQITRKINGGYNGLAKREAYYQQAKVIFAIK